MMAVSERRERAAEILADGLVKLLKRKTGEQVEDDHPDSSKQGRDVPRLKLVHSRRTEEP
jgi:hypothetical protein